MKRIFLALMIVGFLPPLAPPAQADPEVSLDLFYDNLSPYGSWIEVGDYGYCFQPAVAVEQSDWRPYADGYWAYTDVGWTWVSYEDFGWATYHYGRWANLDDYGWVWVPGYEWGPAWVSWRTGGDYVGWAPLLAEPGGVVYEGRAITGAVDVTFGIGPLYYNFVDIRYIGEPVLRGRIIEPRRNITIINNTVNVTNITYNNTTVINHGPDIDRLNRFSTRPIQRLKLQREASVDFKGRRGNLNRVNGNELVVAAPAVQRSQQKVAPRQVKTRVERPKIERGWQGVDNRQQIEAAMKKENAQNVSPPSFTPPQDRKGEASKAGNAGTAGNAGGAGRAVNTERQRPNRLVDQNAEAAGERNGRNAQQQRPQANLERAERPEAGSQNVGAPQNRTPGRKGDGIADGERRAKNAPQPEARRAQPADPDQTLPRAQQNPRGRNPLSPAAQPRPERPERATRTNPSNAQPPEGVQRRAPEGRRQQMEQPRPPEAVQPSMNGRSRPQVRPQQGQGTQAPAGERKGKKRPDAEPTP